MQQNCLQLGAVNQHACVEWEKLLVQSSTRLCRLEIIASFKIDTSVLNENERVNDIMLLFIQLEIKQMLSFYLCNFAHLGFPSFP